MEKKRNKKLINKVIYIAVGAIIFVAAVLTVISIIKITGAYTDTTNEVLKTACEQLDSEANRIHPEGDWTMTEDQKLMKGDVDVTDEYLKTIDDLQAETGLHYTIFIGDTRAITTTKNDAGARTIGTKASDKVISDCLKANKELFLTSVDIGGSKYYAFYKPLLNTDGSVAGMTFAGRAREDIDKEVSGAILLMILLAVGLVAVMAVIGLLFASRVSKLMHSVAGELEVLSSGNLNIMVDNAALGRSDEVGLIADGTQNLSAKLGAIIRQTKEVTDQIAEAGGVLSTSSEQASQASNQITRAVDDISNGAISQAESMQDAENNTDSIGRNIQEISDNVVHLDESSNMMKEACERAMEALERLISSSQEVQESVTEIGDTIASTNESAKEISKFSEAINEIATQTNLLSLNASIEAARAGEAGKGFAVVAGEIGQLAEQSSGSADEIKKIVDKLLIDSERSVEVMQKLNGSFEQQSEQINGTRENMMSMADNVDVVSTNASGISGRISGLSQAKEQLSTIITDLSAIAEENAASTEETNASMSELANTFEAIAGEASNLEKLSQELTDAISFFKL
ncbi:MAG: cache domain-containing protein [Eubacterium sp.]|nr:cache domain-containing protein [Eubacterium sp.]